MTQNGITYDIKERVMTVYGAAGMKTLLEIARDSWHREQLFEPTRNGWRVVFAP